MKSRFRLVVRISGFARLFKTTDTAFIVIYDNSKFNKDLVLFPQSPKIAG